MQKRKTPQLFRESFSFLKTEVFLFLALDPGVRIKNVLYWKTGDSASDTEVWPDFTLLRD